MVSRTTLKVLVCSERWDVNRKKIKWQPANLRLPGKRSLKQCICVSVVIDTCSAAVGSLSSIACAALLFLMVIAAANGVAPALSLIVRLSAGWDSNSEMMV